MIKTNTGDNLHDECGCHRKKVAYLQIGFEGTPRLRARDRFSRQCHTLKGTQVPPERDNAERNCAHHRDRKEQCTTALNTGPREDVCQAHSQGHQHCDGETTNNPERHDYDPAL
ncbi:hypothetical protein GCM10027034_14180 [Ramlibacter solisilvae]